MNQREIGMRIPESVQEKLRIFGQAEIARPRVKETKLVEYTVILEDTDNGVFPEEHVYPLNFLSSTLARDVLMGHYRDINYVKAEVKDILRKARGFRRAIRAEGNITVSGQTVPFVSSEFSSSPITWVDVEVEPIEQLRTELKSEEGKLKAEASQFVRERIIKRIGNMRPLVKFMEEGNQREAVRTKDGIWYLYSNGDDRIRSGYIPS